MGNRIIKESICTSEDLNKLSQSAEILFYRLITKVDDYGCFYGNEVIIKSYCFPLKPDSEIPPESVKNWLQEIADAGIIYLYTAEDGKRYLQFVKWNLHQEIRTQKHKFPTYEDVCRNLQQIETDQNNLPQTETDCRNLPQIETDCDKSEQTSANCCLNPIQSNPIQSKKNPNPNPNTNPNPTKGSGRDYEKDEQFKKFWDAYPKKTGDIRKAYVEYQHAIQSGTPPEVILQAAHDQFDDIDAEEIQFMTSAERWLRNKGWEQVAAGKSKRGQKKAGARRPFEPTTFDD